MDLKNLVKHFEYLGGISPVGSKSFNPLSQKELKELRGRFDFDLPETVIVLLSNFGTFGFEEYVVCRADKPLPSPFKGYREPEVDLFLGKEIKKHEHRSLKFAIKVIGAEMGSNFLPLVRCAVGDYLGVQLESGHVELWVHDEAVGFKGLRMNKTVDDRIMSFKVIDL